MRRSLRYRCGLVGLPIGWLDLARWGGGRGICLLELILLGFLVFACFRGLSIELLRGKLFDIPISMRSGHLGRRANRYRLSVGEGLERNRDKGELTLRLNNAFSSPDMIAIIW